MANEHNCRTGVSAAGFVVGRPCRFHLVLHWRAGPSSAIYRMPMDRLIAVAALLAATVAVSINCSRAADLTPTPTATAAPTLPPCAQAGPAVTPPPQFPKNFPLPPGTVFTGSRSAQQAIVLEGFIPMELPQATRFFLQNLTAAGYRLGRGEAEQGEAEDRFVGNGIIGFFRLRSIRDCPGALQLVITMQPMPSTPSPTPQPK